LHQPLDVNPRFTRHSETGANARRLIIPIRMQYPD
jgi:hypothetical protein